MYQPTTAAVKHPFKKLIGKTARRHTKMEVMRRVAHALGRRC